MANNPRETESPAVEVERQLLRTMCSRQTSREQTSGTIQALVNYGWLVPEHAIVFQAICRAIGLAHGSWRELLPAQATRMGFPDVAWSEYFGTERGEALSLNDLVSQLIH
jgi:hypothetical protein